MNRFKDYLLNTYDKEDIKTIAEHGCASACCSGMIYYRETADLYGRFHESIWDVINNMAEDFGQDGLEMVSEAAKRTNTSIDDKTTFENFLVWMAAEIICQDIMAERENEDEDAA